MIKNLNNDKVWVEMFDEHFNHLVLYVRHYTDSVYIAEDIVQDMFIKLWEKRNGIEFTPSFLFVCARNAAHNYNKLRKIDYIVPDNLNTIIAFESSSFEDEEEYYAMLDKVREAISLLPEQCKIVIRKIYYENKKYADIATEMNLSIGTIKTHAYLAMKTLRGRFHFIFLFFPI